jgi:hypothetical protein
MNSERFQRLKAWNRCANHAPTEIYGTIAFFEKKTRSASATITFFTVPKWRDTQHFLA